jgi:hypothetical protein
MKRALATAALFAALSLGQSRSSWFDEDDRLRSRRYAAKQTEEDVKNVLIGLFTLSVVGVGGAVLYQLAKINKNIQHGHGGQH